jgi:hypothetical protein
VACICDCSEGSSLDQRVNVDVSNATRPRVINHILSQVVGLDHVRFTESGGLHQPAPTNLGNALLMEAEDSGCLSCREWHKVMFLCQKRVVV